MSITVSEQEVYAAWDGGYLDAIIRAESKEAWQTAALSRYLLVEETLDDGATRLKPGLGVVISEIGPLVITPGEYAEDGTEITAPVIDPRHHLNIRLHGYALERMNEDDTMPLWQETVIMWTQQGEVVTEKNANEEARELYQVQLIDPATIVSPARRWL